MSDPQTPNKGLATPLHGSQVDTWDQPLNGNMNVIDTAFGGSVTLNATTLSGDQALSATHCVPASLIITGTPTATITYVVPSGVGGGWNVSNETSGGHTVGIKSAAGGSTVTIPAGATVYASSDGTSRGMVLVTGEAAGADTQVQFNSNGALAGSLDFTFESITSTGTITNLAVTSTLSADTANIVALSFTSLTAGNPLTGMCFWFAGLEANIPANSLVCFGQAISRTSYAALFAKIGTVWGSGDGSTSFNLPDMRGRVPAGADNLGGTPANRLGSGVSPGFTGPATVGAAAGAQSDTLTVDKIPAHHHQFALNPGVNNAQSGGSNPPGGGVTNTGDTGGDSAHNNTQPTIVGVWIIFA